MSSTTREREPARDAPPDDADDADVAVDLFCGAGGASCGIDDAGFEVVEHKSGIDMKKAMMSELSGRPSMKEVMLDKL